MGNIIAHVCLLSFKVLCPINQPTKMNLLAD